MLIKKLQLLTDDLEGTEKFYTQVLGLSVIQKTDKQLTLLAGQTEVSFHPSHQQQPRYHFAFNIPCNQIEEALSWIKNKVQVLDIEPNEPIADFKNWNAKAFYFLDNNENILEFIARNDLYNASAAPFGARSILSVSEIGIVGDEVGEQCRQLIETYGVGYFAKQPPMPNFAALGDDSGLFIVVPDGRDWYPTKIPAAKHWVRIDLEVDGQHKVLELHQKNLL
jgi:catechol 2,3-dioxygenase-like lactoylglutathione lyase family enzyme